MPSDIEQKRSLSIADAIVIVALLAFILIWLFVPDWHLSKKDEKEWLVLVIYLLIVFGPPLWAAELIGEMLRKHR